MKKVLSLLIVFCVSLSTIAAPWDIKSPKRNYATWDKPLEKARAFDDTYCDFYIGYVTGNWPAQTLSINATLNQSPPVKWLVQIQVLGVWQGTPGYPSSAEYKVFNFIYSTAQWNKTIDYHFATPSETAYPGVMDLIYDGPY